MTDQTSAISRQPRSLLMRERLLSAALEVISEEGWAETSTPKICAKAGVSRGAQTHHFPTKSELMMAALESVASAHEAAIIQSVESIPDGERTLKSVLKAVWDSCQDDRFMQPSLEALVASRTNAELHSHVAPRDKQAIAKMRAVAELVRSDDRSIDEIANIVELSVYLFRGIAMERGLHPDEKYRDGLFEVWYRLLT